MTDMPAYAMLPQQLLTAMDKSISGQPMTRDQRAAARRVWAASTFAATAFERSIDASAGAHTLARTFVLALIDPLHPDLDYLRADPASGAAERAKREAPHG